MLSDSTTKHANVIKIIAVFVAVMVLVYLYEDKFVSHGTMMMSDLSGKMFNSPNITATHTSTSDAVLLKKGNVHQFYNLGETHEKRKSTLDRACAKRAYDYLGDSKADVVAGNIFVDQRHNLVYCKVQKAGSTFLKKLFRAVSEAPQNANIPLLGLTSLKSLENDNSFTKLHRVLSDSFKIMFTRDPYSRLFSGYVDKLFTVNTRFWKITGAYIKKKILKEPSTKCGHDITFPQFIKYVIESEATAGKHTNPHFSPIYEHCRPCQMSYDFIGKMETFMDDSLFLLNTWKRLYGLNITFNDFEAETALDRAVSHSSRLYGMRTKLEMCTTFYAGMRRIWKDLQIRGLLSKNVSLPFSEKEAEYVNKTQFVASLTQAIQGPDVDRKYLRKQKRESLIQAYSEVPMDDLVRLREVVRPDCELFGYDDSPDYIFSRNNPAFIIDAFKYFDI